MEKTIIIEEKGRGRIVLYQTPDGKTSLDVKLENETVWLTQAQMALLFETTKQNVSLHINNVFKEGELSKGEVVKESLITTIFTSSTRNSCILSIFSPHLQHEECIA